MTSLNKKDLSVLVQSAVLVDEEFARLESLGGQIERCELESDKDFEHARKLLVRFGETGQRIGEQVAILAKALDDARVRAEASAKSVTERAALIQARQTETDRLIERFKTLGEMARNLTEAVAELHKPALGVLSPEDRARLGGFLPEVVNQLGALVDEAKRLKEEARAAGLKTLERDADALSQSLQSMRAKLEAIVRDGFERPASA